MVQDYLPAVVDRTGKRLTDLISYLNSDVMVSRRLRDYADSWLECAPNAMDWRNRYTHHWKTLLAALEHTHLTLVATPQGCYFASDRTRDLGSAEAIELWRADKLFADFLTESQDRLGICKGCGRYFAKTAKRTEYHDELCARKTTARQANDRSHHAKRHQKFGRMITIVRNLLSEGNTKTDLRSEDFWKEQVMKRGKRTGFSVRWINETVDDSRQDPAWKACAECAAYRSEIQKLVGVKEKANGKG